MKKTLSFILIILLFALFVLICLNFLIKDFDLVTYLSAISSFIIAILTVFYVLVNSKQLDVMSSQLKEMKKDRELQNQPLPWLENLCVEIEAPRLFYSPPIKEHSFISRYNVVLDLVNLSDSPAISIDIVCKVLLVNGEEEFELTSTSERLDALSGNGRYPAKEGDHKVDFLFAEDDSAKFFDMLRDYVKTPIIKVVIYYRNFLGGCFSIENRYQIFQSGIDDEILHLWHTDIASFHVKEKETIDELITLKNNNNDQEWTKYFNLVCSRYKYEKSNIILNAHSIPGSLNVMVLNEDEYLALLEDVTYSRRLKQNKRKIPCAQI